MPRGRRKFIKVPLKSLEGVTYGGKKRGVEEGA
jgi:hypothetical protein